MKHKAKIHYYATIRGISQLETQKDLVYYGLSYRIKRDDFTGAEHRKKEKEILDTIEGWLDDGQVLKGGTIERYEVFDIESDDIIVMWRIPFVVGPSQNPPKGGYAN